MLKLRDFETKIYLCKIHKAFLFLQERNCNNIFMQSNDVTGAPDRQDVLNQACNHKRAYLFSISL